MATKTKAQKAIAKNTTATLTREQMIALVDANLPTNGNNEITAADLREVLTSFADNLYAIMSDQLQSIMYNNTYTLGGFLDDLIFCAGDVAADHSITNRIKGDFTVENATGFTNSNPSEHKITHELGHENYICLGVALGERSSRTIKFNCYNKTAEYCEVVTADDGSTNPSPFSFIIINLQPYSTN